MFYFGAENNFCIFETFSGYDSEEEAKAAIKRLEKKGYTNFSEIREEKNNQPEF